MNDNDRSIVGFTMLSHALVHTYELSIPILMTNWLVEFTTTPATLGTIVAVGYGLMGLGALPSGILVDVYGSRTMIIGCLASMGASFLILGFAPTLPWVAVALCLWGAAASVYHPAGLSLLSRGVTVRGRAFGYHGMGGNAGIALGPLATTLLLLVFDWEVVAAILAIPALLAAFYGLGRNFDETAAVASETAADADRGASTATADGGDSPTGQRLRPSTFRSNVRTLFTAGFTLVFVMVMFNGLYYRGVLTFLPDLLGDFLGAGGTSLPFVSSGGTLGAEFDLGRYLYSGLLTVGIVGQYVGGRIVERFSTEWSFATILGLLGVIAVAFVPAASLGTVPLLLSSVCLGFLVFSVQPISQAIVAAYSPADVRGLSYGFTYLAVFGVGAFGASITGIILTYSSVTTMFLVLAGIAASGCVISLVLMRTQRNSETVDATA